MLFEANTVDGLKTNVMQRIMLNSKLLNLFIM
jgi:hypothetical protein